MSSSSSEQLPMLYGGDAYFLTLMVSEYEVRLTKIARYANNQNTVGEISRFYDLDPMCQAAIIRQIRRRHNKVTIRV